MRIGLGIDVHQFTTGRPLIMGGIIIPHTKGLKGHSDADVLLHAISDALLGALALGDIGHYFPDNDKQWKNMDSSIILRKAYELIRENGYCLQNIDTTIITEQPKIAPHISKMQDNIAKLISCSPSQISIKATTCEQMGFIGREEGIAVHAIVLLKRDNEMNK